jgi:hypothetical protein
MAALVYDFRCPVEQGRPVDPNHGLPLGPP